MPAPSPRACRAAAALSKSTTGNYTDLNMRLDMAPGNKKDFIDGMKHIVNREQIVKSVLRGFGVVGND